MSTAITIVTDNKDFAKQVVQILPTGFLQGHYEVLPSGADLKHAKMIVTDGCDTSVYAEGIPIFTIADSMPCNEEESASVRFYKKGAFSPNVFAKDVLEWSEIIGALECATEDACVSEEKERECKRKLGDIQKNLSYASELQKNVILSQNPKDFELAIYYKPVEHVSGDLFLTEEVGDKLFVVIGDVTDHGYLAGLYGASLYSLIKGYLSLASKFEADVKNLAQYVQYASSFYQPQTGELKQKATATMLFCEIDKKRNVAKFVNCGHGNESPVRIFDQNKAEIVAFDIENGSVLPAIGDYAVVSPGKTTDVPFYPGDSLVFYTDGITEIFKDSAKKSASDEYSTERLLASVRYEIAKENWNAGTVLEGIRKDAESYSISSKLDKRGSLDGATDDITVAILRWKEGGTL